MSKVKDYIIDCQGKGVTPNLDNKFDGAEQRTDEWFKARMGKFTASNFANLLVKGRAKDVIFGDTAKTMILEKLAERLTGERVDIFVTAAMQHGIDNEAPAIKLYEEKTGVTVADSPFIPLIGYEDYCGGSPDGIVEGMNGIIEVKCMSSAKHLKVLTTGKIPSKDAKKYETQMQLNMLCTGAEFCDFISYDPRMKQDKHKLKVVRFNRDEEQLALIVERLNLAIEEITKMELMLE